MQTRLLPACEGEYGRRRHGLRPFCLRMFFLGGGDAQQGCPDSGGNVFCAATVVARGMKKARGQKAFAEENIAGGGGENERGRGMKACRKEDPPKGVGRAAPEGAFTGKEGHRKTKGRNSVAPFWEPDTRQQPLPLLPFGPGGVGGATAVRFPVCLRSDDYYSWGRGRCQPAGKRPAASRTGRGRRSGSSAFSERRFLRGALLSVLARRTSPESIWNGACSFQTGPSSGCFRKFVAESLSVFCESTCRFL